ncbi:MAG: ribonuclease J, partial [Candidatus Zixiibacteriota bacterium]
KVIPFGGLEEVGRNMMGFEYGNDIIIVDMGLQFPDENTPGIDYIIPDVSYLEKNIKKIRGIVITHGHYDHIGAIPHIINKIGNPPILATPLIKGMILKRQEEHKNLPKLNIKDINEKSRVKAGSFSIEFFRQNHNIPDSIGVVLNTPVGTVVHTGDFKFDEQPVYDKPTDFRRLEEIGKKKVLLLMSDSTDAEKPGHSIPEKTIMENLDGIFHETKGRIIAATFASLLNRVQQIIHLSEQHGRKFAIVGYSMRTNFEIAKELGYIKHRKETIIDPKKIDSFPKDKITIICTGAQGEPNAALMRMANQEHRDVKLIPNDTIIFSSSVVPGNDQSVATLKDTLYKRGAKVLHYRMMDIHAGGHAPREDLKKMIEIMKPKFFMPIEGNYYMLKLHSDIAESAGIPKENIVIGENGRIVEVTPDKIKMTDKRIPADYVMVDGLGVGDVGQVVLRDRKMLAEDGIFVIISTVYRRTGKVKGNPDIISRGFVYMKESKELLAQTRKKTKNIVEKATANTKPVNWDYVRNNIKEKIGSFLYSKTKRRPMVLPVVIEV